MENLSIMNVNEQSLGFVLVCEDNVEVSVPDDKARKLFEQCDFFANVFRHVTKECENRRIEKTDWTAMTANAVFQLVLTKGRYKLQNAVGFLNLINACDQILLPIRLIPFGAVRANNEDNIGQDSIVKLSNIITLNPLQWKLETQLKLSLDSYHDMLDKSIAILTNDDYICETEKEPVSDDLTLSELVRLNAFRNMRSPFGWSINCTQVGFLVWNIHCNEVGLPCSLFEVYKTICDVFSFNGNDSNEELSLRVPLIRLCPPKDDFQALCEKSGASFYFHRSSSAGFYFEWSNDFIETFNGTFQQLQATLELLSEESIATTTNRSTLKTHKACALRIKAPKQNTVSELVRACQYCVENRNSIGADFQNNAMSAIKTVQDMNILFSHLSNRATELHPVDYSDFRMVHLDYQKGVF